MVGRTSYDGSFTLTPALSQEQVEYLRTYTHFDYRNDDFEKRNKSFDPVDFPNGIPDDPKEIDCGWLPSQDGSELSWDYRETLSRAYQWLEYLTKNIFTPWGVKINGVVSFFDEEMCCSGRIIAKNNTVDSLVDCSNELYDLNSACKHFNDWEKLSRQQRQKVLARVRKLLDKVETMDYVESLA